MRQKHPDLFAEKRKQMGKCFIEIECDVCQNWQAKLCSVFYLKERMILAVHLSDHINRATEIGKQRILEIRRSGTTY